MKPKICVMMIFVLGGLALAAGCINHVPEPGNIIACDSLVTITGKYESPISLPASKDVLIQRYIQTSDGRTFSVAISMPRGIDSQNRLWESLSVGTTGIVDNGVVMTETMYGFTRVNVTRSRPSCPNCCEVVP